MKAKIAMTFVVVSMLVLGVFATMLALGMFTTSAVAVSVPPETDQMVSVLAMVDPENGSGVGQNDTGTGTDILSLDTKTNLAQEVPASALTLAQTGSQGFEFTITSKTTALPLTTLTTYATAFTGEIRSGPGTPAILIGSGGDPGTRQAAITISPPSGTGWSDITTTAALSNLVPSDAAVQNAAIDANDKGSWSFWSATMQQNRLVGALTDTDTTNATGAMQDGKRGKGDFAPQLVRSFGSVVGLGSIFKS